MPRPLPQKQLNRTSPRPTLAKLAAPGLVGGITAIVAALGTSLEVFKLPMIAGVGITVTIALLAGLAAWATQRAVGKDEGDKPEALPEGVRPAELPPAIAHFTGRSDSLDELRSVFSVRKKARRTSGSETPLVVSVHGPAGVGKSALVTRFAHEVARDYPDGQLYFDLRGGRDTRTSVSPQDVLTGFLLALGVRLSTDPGGLAELQKLWWSWMQGRKVLIFLDNAENSEQVQTLLPSEPRCAVLVTSRQPLYLRGTYDKRLPEFTEAQGVELLSRLAGNDRVANDPEAAADIVRLCGNLPLAISICGARLAARSSWSLRELADRLSDERRRRLDELEVAGHVDKTVRIDKSVRASLQLSYDECNDLQRRLLRAFGLLTTPDVPAWTAGALLGVSELDGGDQMEALVDLQLVDYAGGAATRYRLHDLVRLYAKEQAEKEDSSESRRAVIERFAEGYRDRAEAIAAGRWPQDWHRRGGRHREPQTGPLATEWLSSERLVMVAAITQAVDYELWGLAARLGRAFCSLCHSLRSFWPEWRAVAQLAVDAGRRSGDTRSEAIALLERSAMLGGQGNLALALTDARHALGMFVELREEWWAARARRAIGTTLRNSGNLDEGQQFLTEAIDGFEEEGDSWWQARTQRNLAEVRLAQRRYPEALALLEQSLVVFERDRNRYSEAQTLRALGEVLAAQARPLRADGKLRAAERKATMASLTLERAAEMFRERREQWEEAKCLRAAGEVGVPGGGLRELRFVRRARSILEGLGDSWGVARTLVAESRALNNLHRGDEAITTLREAVGAFQSLGDRWWEARTIRRLAELFLESGRPLDAAEPAAEAVELYQRLGDEYGVRMAQDILTKSQS